MAAAVIKSDDEEDIWNYKCTKASKTRKESTGAPKPNQLNSVNTKRKDMSSNEGKQVNVVIDIDSDDDFPFTKRKPVNNEKSAAKWASMFTKMQDKNNKTIDVCKDKKGIRSNKRKLVPSRSPLKTKTNQQRKSIYKDSSTGIKNYISPTKTFSKKTRFSSSDKVSISLEEIDEVPDSVLNFKNRANEKEKFVGSSESLPSHPVESEADEELNSVKQTQSQSERDDVSTTPKVVDVIILDDESEVSTNFTNINETHSIDRNSASDDDDMMGSDTEFGGGFVREDVTSHSSQQISKSELPQTQTSPIKMSTSSSLSSLPTSNTNAIPSDKTSHNDDVSTAPSVPLSTAARKQISIVSFFNSKVSISTSKPKSAADHAVVKAIDSGVKQNGFPTLTKSVTYPLEKTSSQGSSKEWPSSSSSRGTYQNKRGQRQCPFYKRIPGTSFTVDAFRYGDIPDCNAYFLTHFHYDHYGGLTKKFANPIYCSKVTGNLVEKRLGVDKKWIRRLPMWKPVTVEEVTLTLMEANHCPGAVIVLFETKNGKKILHTGDFRASIEMEDYPALKNISFDELYLDTTYCNPSYAFPSQKTVIDFAVSLVEKQLTLNPNTLVVCGAYTIGKERIFTAIAKAVDSKICVMSDKKKVLDCLEDEELKKRVTLNWSEGQVHVLPMKMLQQKNLFAHHERHARYTSVLAFKPTGWTHSNKAISLENIQPEWSRNGISLYGVPYSEHSSFLELKRFVQFTRPKKILPTVNNGNAAARQKMENIFEEWLSE